MANPYKTVKLRNGNEESHSAVKATMTCISDTMDEGMPGAIALTELRRKCLDPNYKIPPDANQTLINTGLLNHDGDLHDSTRNIFLSATEGDGISLGFRSPYAE